MSRAQGGGEEPRETDPAALLDRWTAHQADAGLREGSARTADQVDDTPSSPAPSSAPRHAAAPRPAAGGERATDSVLASREVLGALGPALEADPEPATGPDPVDTRPGESLDVTFAPKLFARRVVGLLLLAALVATLGAGAMAYDDPRPLTLGAAAILLVLTLALYAVRAGSAPTYVAIRSGQLEVRRGKSIERFDLTSRYTRIEVVGRAGRPGWKLVLGRFGREPLVLTASVVDPRRLTEQLERYRPRP